MENIIVLIMQMSNAKEKTERFPLFSKLVVLSILLAAIFLVAWIFWTINQDKKYDPRLKMWAKGKNFVTRKPSNISLAPRNKWQEKDGFELIPVNEFYCEPLYRKDYCIVKASGNCWKTRKGVCKTNEIEYIMEYTSYLR